MGAHLSELESARFKAATSFILAILMVFMSEKKWAERIAIIELCFLAISLVIVYRMPFNLIFSAHYGSIALTGFALELWILFLGAISDRGNNHNVHGYNMLGNREGKK